MVEERKKSNLNTIYEVGKIRIGCFWMNVSQNANISMFEISRKNLYVLPDTTYIVLPDTT